MSTSENKPIQSSDVLTVTRPAPSRSPSNQSINVLTTIEDVESTHSLTPTPSFTRNEKSVEREREHSPFSPFYNPTPTRHSLEKAKSESRQNINVIGPNPYETDIEALALENTNKTNTTGRISLLKSKSRKDLECQVWPGQSQLREKKKEMRRRRGEDLICCGCMTGLNRKTKMWLKILIALIVVGIAVGVGVGVSKAVGGGVWKNKNNPNAPIDS